MTVKNGNLRRYQTLQSKVQRLQREVDKTSGVLAELKRTLRDEFDCHTIKEAKKLLNRIREQEKALGKQFDSDLDRFEKDWQQKNALATP